MFAVLNCIPLPQRPFYQSAGIIGQFREGKKLQKIPNAARFLWELVVIIGQFKRFARWTRCKKRVLPCNGGRQEPRLQRLPNFGQIISIRLYKYIWQRYVAYIPFNDGLQILQIWSCKDPLCIFENRSVCTIKTYLFSLPSGTLMFCGCRHFKRMMKY